MLLCLVCSVLGYQTFFNFLIAVVMQSYIAKRTSALLAWGFAALWAAMIVAAGGTASAAPTETVLHVFTGGSDGGVPWSGLIADSKGNLYGTTALGGASGCGTVFKLTPPATAGGAWTETVLYSFSGLPGDGYYPRGGLIADSKGNLYGTTEYGSASNAHTVNGIVFKLTPPASTGGAWTETVLHAFTGGSDGGFPFAGLIANSRGNLYGTTFEGGSLSSCSEGCGIVFELAPPAVTRGAWTETVLYAFTGGSDGAYPFAGLLADSKGKLYGATAGGALTGAPGSAGTVFELAPPATANGAWTQTVLGSDVGNPYGGLIADSNGNLYGTTLHNVFKLAPPATAGGAWTETVLYSFCSLPNCSDGTFPQAGLIADSKGSLYGTTHFGGSSSCEDGCGTVFKLTPPAVNGGAWTETVLHAFTGGSDGAAPYAGLITDSKGNLYGTTEYGASGWGTVFELTGTGFVPAVSFNTFSGTLDIHFGKEPSTDKFELRSKFTLGQSSNGINPPVEPVALAVGTFTMTIPPGSFQGGGHGPFHFVGTIDGVLLRVGFVPTGSKRYAFTAVAENASLTGTTNPVTVTLTIGDDTGTTSIKAKISGPEISRSD
jgi:uncharacterized repeat protein (TIGR03803 family)